MIAIAYYLLKMLICSGILVGYYYIGLRNKLFHQWNRFYLLLTVVVSIVFPLLYIPLFDAGSQTNTLEHMVVTISASEFLLLQQKVATTPFWQLATLFIYIIVVAVLITLLITGVYKIYILKRRSKCVLQNDIAIYETNVSQAPFSFFKNIFWKQGIDMHSAKGRKILQHELVHVHEMHSADKIFMQIALSVFWFNPFFILIKKELAVIHEFIADKKSVGNNDASVLASLILTTAYSSGRFDITNPFFQSSIKRRIKMITKNKNPKISYFHRLAALCVLLATFMMFAFRSKEVKSSEPQPANITMIADTVPTVKEKKPATTKDEVVVVGYGYKRRDSKDTIRVYGEPKKVAVELFRLEGDTTKIYIVKKEDSLVENSVESEPKTGGDGIKLRSVKPGEEPLYLVDGKEITREEFKKISANDVESVNVLRDKSAIEKYGEKGKNGVVLIVRKKSPVKVEIKNE